MTDRRTYDSKNVSSAQNGEPSMSEYFDSYLQMNPGTGYLTFEVFNDSPVRGRVPVSNAKITVSMPLGGDYYISKIITTNESGETDPLALPTVSRDISLQPGGGRAYTPYYASVEAPGFARKDIFDVEIFEDITSVQRVPLQQIARSGGAGSGPVRFQQSEG